MKMKACPNSRCGTRPTCSHARAHEHAQSCDESRNICGLCVPVATPANKLVAWVVWGVKPGYKTQAAWSSREIARSDAAALRRSGWRTRGPVKVEVEL